MSEKLGKNGYELRFRLWIEREGEVVFGDGKAKLLELIDEKGSLVKASAEMGMSYRHAWGLLKEMEKAAGFALVVSERGGKEGGRTYLTDRACELLDLYHRKRKEIERTVSYGRVDVTADGLLEIDGKILMIRRRNEPFKDMLALPGGFLDTGETIEECVVREMKEETGVDVEIAELLGVFSAPNRDPRGRTVSAAYILRLKDGGKLEIKAGDDASAVELVEPGKLRKDQVAFDHMEIIEMFMAKKGKRQ